MKFLVVDENLYFYSVEKDCICPYKKGKVIRIIKKIFDKLNICYPYFILNKELYKATAVVISDSAYGGNENLLNTLQRKKIRYCLYYMNPIDESNVRFMKNFEKVFTSDYKDALKYNIRFKEFGYPLRLGEYNQEDYPYEYDCIFLGNEKGRSRQIYELKELLQSAGLKIKFMVLGSTDTEIAIQSFLDYFKYIDMLKRSRCIVELLQEGQTGLSLRAREAYAFKKKLITNNRSMVNISGFSDDNIYVLGVDARNINEFVKSDYNNRKTITIDDFADWLKGFEELL